MLNKAPVFLSVLTVLLIIFTGPVFGRTVVIAAGNYAPWTGEDLEDSGSYLRVVRKVFNRAGYGVEFEFYPWKRALVMARKGKVHASAYWWASERREKDFYFSEPLSRDRVVFFYRQDNPLKEWEDLEDLKEYRIGVTRGHTYTDEFWKKSEEGVLNFDKANNDLNNLRKLINGRIDILASEKARGYALLNKHFSDEIAARVSHSPKPLTITPCHLIFSKARENSSKLLQEFNEQLRELKGKDNYDSYWEDINVRKRK